MNEPIPDRLINAAKSLDLAGRIRYMSADGDSLLPLEAPPEPAAMLRAITKDYQRMLFISWLLIFIGSAVIVALLLAGVRP